MLGVIIKVVPLFKGGDAMNKIIKVLLFVIVVALLVINNITIVY